MNALTRDLMIHNEIVRDLILNTCDITTDYLFRYPGGVTMRMERGDLPANPDYQRELRNDYSIGLPLMKSSIVIGNDTSLYDWRMIAEADIACVRKAMQRAIFNACNDLGYIDLLGTPDADGKPKAFPLYAFLNGDGMPIPVAADGTSFESPKHTHYTASQHIDETVVRSLLMNVSEHILVGDWQLWVNWNDAPCFADFQKTGSFFPYVSSRLEGAVDTMDFSGDPENRAIGYFDGAEVHTKLMVPEGYMVAVDLGAPGYKPLGYRIDDDGTSILDHGLITERDDDGILKAVRKFGIASLKRHMLAVHQFNSEHGFYTIPSF